MSSGLELLVSAARVAGSFEHRDLVVASNHIAERVLAADPGMAERLTVLPVEPQSRDAFAAAAAFERERYESYVPLLSNRLNQIHGLNRSESFWDTVIGLTLLMHVSNCRRSFALGRLAIANGYGFATLATECFLTPADESSYRRHFQYSDLGEEQLFATFVQCSAAAGRYPEFSVDSFRDPGAPRRSTAGSPRGLHRLVRAAVERLRDDLAWPARTAAVSLLKLVRRPTVLVTRCFWSIRAKQKVQLKSRGRILVDDLAMSYPRRAAEARSPARDFLAAAPEDADEFDRYFFFSLRWAAPTSWVEDFPARLAMTESALFKRPWLRSIANETLDEEISLLLAAGKDRGISALYCEHNYLQHQFLGNIVWFLLRKVDVYLSLGWSSDESSKIVPAGSYFAWTAERAVRRDIHLLFVASVAIVRPPLTSAGYGEAGSKNAALYYQMTRRFLDGLSRNTLSKTYYKDYPAERRSVLFVHPLDRDLLLPYEGRLGVIDRTGVASTPSLLSRSRLVVVNYLSTSYNQALMADVPTVVLFNSEAYYLAHDHSDFYDELLDAGVFQSDPVAAAAFVERIQADPDSWWLSEPVVQARANYLRRNFGDPDALGRYLLDAADGVRRDAA